MLPMNEEERFDFEQKHEEDLQRLRGFRLLDDDFMSKVFEDKNCVEFLLQIILKRDDLKVTSVSSQYVIKNLQGRSVRLDILAVDRQNQVYNIEIQRDDKGAGVKRARYNSSLIDANVTEPGEQYQNLNETYVVFITENDVLGENIPIYHVDRIVRETGKMFNDQSHIIYVNSQIKDETALGKLMHDFTCTNAKDFVVLTSRSKMKVCIVEVKGADFKTVKANHYQGLNVHMNDAITQLKNHMEYINRNYSSFRTQIHEDKDKAINEEYSGNYLVGPRKNLLVDPQKDIDVKYIAIGGVEREDKSIEESHEIVKCKPADNLEIASWNSFVRKLDEYHGHHPVQ